MLTYNSSLQNHLPYSPLQRNSALAALTVKSPYGKFGSTHQDILNAMGGRNAANFDVAATKANADYQLAQQEAQRQLALQGLQQMSNAQQNQNELTNTRLQNMYGVANNLLGGLFN
jgi:hypothetical protein